MRRKSRRLRPKVRLRTKLRKERIRAVATIAGVIIALTALAGGILAFKNIISDFLHSDTFIIKDVAVAVDGGHFFPDTDKVEAQAKYLLLNKKIPIWHADYKKISSLLMEKFPRIKTVKFRPASATRVVIRINGRKPIALVPSEIAALKTASGGYKPAPLLVATDEEGVFFPPDEKTELQSLPVIKNISRQENIKDILRFLKDISSADADFSKKIKSISADGFILSLDTCDGYTILWGDISEAVNDKIPQQTRRKIFHTKISAAHTVIKDALERYGKCSYIDLGTLDGGGDGTGRAGKTKRVVVSCVPQS